jgi:glycosyltransferase involved in cell wall biosynthesis
MTASEHGVQSVLTQARGPWLTVVIPSFHGESWIDTALGSLAKETTDGIEVVLIDGGPTSATRDIAHTYGDRLRLRVIERCDLKSWQAKTNFGVQQAESDHVCWLGVDDIWLPGRAAAARSWIDGAPSMGVWRCPFAAQVELLPRMVTERLLVQNFIAAPAPIFRKDAWIERGGVDESLWYTADWDAWLKLVANGPVIYHDEVTVGFRIHARSLTVSGSRDRADFLRQMQTVLSRHLESLDGFPERLEQTARASISVNSALAAANAGDLTEIVGACLQVLRLGPTGIYRYFRDSRIVERLLPRVRAKLSAALSV